MGARCPTPAARVRRIDALPSSYPIGDATPGDAKVDAYEDAREDDANQEGNDLESAILVGVSQFVAHPGSKECANRAQYHSHHDADVLLAGHDEPGQSTHDEPDDDGANNCPDHLNSSGAGRSHCLLWKYPFLVVLTRTLLN
jgi:hypothetical protein